MLHDALKDIQLGCHILWRGLNISFNETYLQTVICMIVCTLHKKVSIFHVEIFCVLVMENLERFNLTKKTVVSPRGKTEEGKKSILGIHPSSSDIDRKCPFSTPQPVKLKLCWKVYILKSNYGKVKTTWTKNISLKFCLWWISYVASPLFLLRKLHCYFQL